MSNTPKISVVIVNYNVKEYLEQALLSLRRALREISHQIFVVDNASLDGSAAHIRQRFPEAILIESQENLGFGRANNLALQQVTGEYVVLINPDTVVQEDTFTELLKFFDQTPEAAGATCKIINSDGSFSVDCRHAIPTPIIAFWKVVGLSRLFPRSKIFGQYNLTYLDPDDTYPVPAISGSFMMFRKKVLDEVGYFDERFFMYCEDIDLCYRVNQAGYKIFYVPTTQIIHYKGESTKKNNIDYVVTFNKALYQFFQKHFAHKTLLLFRWLILLGIIFRGVFIYIRNFLHEHFPLILDTLLLNAGILAAFVVRFELKNGFEWANFFNQYWIINLISTLIFLGSAYYLNVYPHHRFSIQGIIKANVLVFTLLASLTFFLKQFAFSRMVVLFATMLSPLLMIGWRGILKRYYQGDKSAWGKDLYSKPTVIVGDGKAAAALYAKVQEMKDISYDLLGVVTVDKEEQEPVDGKIPVLGRLEHLASLVSMYRVRQVIFSSEMLSYERILSTMSSLDKPYLEYKIAPSNLEVMIGKSSIERLDDYPLLDIEYALGKPFNRLIKRIMDITLAGIMLTSLAPVVLPVMLFTRRSRQTREFIGERGNKLVLRLSDAPEQRKFADFLVILTEILRGRCSLVGAPLKPFRNDHSESIYWYKPGLTGLVQLNQAKIATPGDEEKYHLFYLKNQSLMLDLEILVKTLFLRIA